MDNPHVDEVNSDNCDDTNTNADTNTDTDAITDIIANNQISSSNGNDYIMVERLTDSEISSEGETYTASDVNIDTTILWESSVFTLLLTGDSSIDSINGNSVDRCDFKFRIEISDDAAKLLLLDPVNISVANDTINYLRLDLQARMIRIMDECKSVTGDNIVLSYYYDRNDIRYRIDILPTTDCSNIDERFHSLEYIFKQYVIFSTITANDSNTRFLLGSEIENANIKEIDTQANIVARSFENSGIAIRQALKSGGSATGHAIRFLGDRYTAASVYMNKKNPSTPPIAVPINVNTVTATVTATTADESIGSTNACAVIVDDSAVAATPVVASTDVTTTDVSIHSQSQQPQRVVNQQMIDKALARKKMGESVHASARTLTSALLYPVRYVGKVTSGYASTTSSSYDGDSKAKKILLETMGGIGNGFASVCKGLTEGLEEIGAAVSDAAMDHSKTIHGEEYCNQVTKRHMEAMGEIGLGIYKVGNVATFGLTGIFLDGVIEGTTYLVSLYEYLVGPVILQGYMDVAMLPFTKPKWLFVVLRPWSIAFYKKCSDFTKKPYKIIATCMLDTIPLKRDSCSSTSTSSTRSSSNSTSSSGSSSDGSSSSSSSSSSSRAGLSMEKQSYLQRLKGGNRKNIEITTVDCSTYLFFPPDDRYNIWYDELKAASLRVETISKRQSGAYELAIYKRLKLLPKCNTISISIKQILLSPIFNSHAAAVDYFHIDEPMSEGDEGIELKSVISRSDTSMIISTEEGSGNLANSSSSSSGSGRDVNGDAYEEDQDIINNIRDGAVINDGNDDGYDRCTTLGSSADDIFVNRVTVRDATPSHYKSSVSAINKRIESFKYSLFNKCCVEVVPIHVSGVKVLNEIVHKDGCVLLPGTVDKYNSDVGNTVINNGVSPFSQQDLQIDSHSKSILSCTYQDDCNFDLGNKSCLSRREVERIDVNIHVETSVLSRKRMFMGRVVFPLASVSSGACGYTWVEIYSKGGDRVVGKMLVSLVHDGN